MGKVRVTWMDLDESGPVEREVFIEISDEDEAALFDSME